MTDHRFSVRFSTFALALAAPLAAQWGEQTPASAPSARSGHGMCFDGSRALLVGGSAGFSTSNELWSYDGANWSALAALPNAGGVTGVELVYDSLRGVAVLYGGLNTSFFGGPSIDETWEFDGVNWTQNLTATTTPGGLGIYGACFDSTRNVMVLYGGSADSFFPIASAAHWEYDGTNWTQVSAAATPGPLERPAMCYHAGAGVTVMFGGIDPQTGGVDTTWLYDGVTWQAAGVAGARPVERTGCKMAYDSVREVCVLSGGMNPMTGQPIVDTWELAFDAGTTTWTWTQVPTSTTPHRDGAMTFLPGIRQVVEFGGLDPATFSDSGATWHYGAKVSTYGAGCAGTFGIPSLTAADAPRLGFDYAVTLGNLDPAATIAAFVIGLSDQTSTFGALPFDLSGAGMTGCSLLVSNDVSVFIGTDPSVPGTATLTTALPSDITFLGLPWFHQGLSLDFAANAAGLTISNAVASTVGN